MNNYNLETRFEHGVLNISTLREMVDNQLEIYADGTAFSLYNGFEYESINYKEAQARIRNIASHLILNGVKKGDVVGLMSENRMEWPIVYLAVTTIGAIIVPLDIFFTSGDLSKVVDYLDPKALFVSEIFSGMMSNVVNVRGKHTDIYYLDNLSEKLSRLDKVNRESSFCQWRNYQKIENDSSQNHLYRSVYVEPADSASLIYMTGNSYAELTHASLVANIYGMLKKLHDNGQHFLPREKTLAPLAFHHSWPTLGGFLIPYASYGETMILPKFTPNAFAQSFADMKASYAIMVPLLLDKILGYLEKNNTDLDSLKFMIVGGAATHISILEGLSKRGCPVLQMYGLSECSPTITVTTPNDIALGSIGQVIDGLEYKIRATHENGIGELLVRGTSVMKGYYKQEQETKYMIRDGWLYTGDLVRSDQRGNFYIIGRCRDLVVNKGGKNIYPKDLEERIKTNEFISDVKVIAKIDDIDGEYPFARLLIGEQELERIEMEIGEGYQPQELKEFLLKQVEFSMSKTASYKTPKDLEVIVKEESIDKNSVFFFGDYYMTELAASPKPRSPVEGEAFVEVVDEAYHLIDRFLIEKIFSEFLDRDQSITRETQFEDYGIDSLAMLSIRYSIEKSIGTPVNLALLGSCHNVAEITRKIVNSGENKEIKIKIIEVVLDIDKNIKIDKDVKKIICHFILDKHQINKFSDKELKQVYSGLVGIRAV